MMWHLPAITYLEQNCASDWWCCCAAHFLFSPSTTFVQSGADLAQTSRSQREKADFVTSWQLGQVTPFLVGIEASCWRFRSMVVRPVQLSALSMS